MKLSKEMFYRNKVFYFNIQMTYKRVFLLRIMLVTAIVLILLKTCFNAQISWLIVSANASIIIGLLMHCKDDFHQDDHKSSSKEETEDIELIRRQIPI